MSVRPLHPALAEKARLELNEEPMKLAESILELKEWIRNQPYLRARTDDQWLAAFLRGTKFRLDQTKAKIELYYTLRSTAPDLYTVKYYDPKVMDILDLGAILIVPKVKNPDDPKIVLLRPGRYNTKEYSILDILTVAGFLYQISFMEDDNITVAGMISITDFADCKLGHYTQTSLKQIRNIVLANQDAVPMRIKSVHYLNTSSLFESIMNIAKRLCSQKLQKRMNVHSNINSLHKIIPKEVLPIEYGGPETCILEIIDYWKRKIRDYRLFLDEDLLFGSDESKRKGKSKQKSTSKQIKAASPPLEID